MNRNLGTLATAAGLLIAGGFTAFKDTGNAGASALFLSAGLIFLGAYLAIEILKAWLTIFEDRKKKEHEQ